jgi:hypothetical protein
LRVPSVSSSGNSSKTHAAAPRALIAIAGSFGVLKSSGEV